MFHRVAAYVLLAFALLHPLSYAADVLLVDPIAAWHRLTGMLASHRLRSGVLAIAGLIVMVSVASIRSRSFMRYEYWRMSHGSLAIIVAALTLYHVWAVGTYSEEYPLRAIWVLYALLAVVAMGLAYVIRPWRMWREDWRVERVAPLADRVWEMILRGPDTTRFRFRGRAVHLDDARPQSPTLPRSSILDCLRRDRSASASPSDPRIGRLHQ